jgi:CPA2 family monovalent cation:H+ antiporter-2
MAKACTHLDGLAPVTPSSPDSCPQCVARGDTWYHLRVCLVCGQVGCCDNSKNQHATRHFRETAHAVMQSYQPGEPWRWCFADDAYLPDAKEPFRK